MAERINIDTDKTETEAKQRPPRGERQPRNTSGERQASGSRSSRPTTEPRRRSPQDRKVIDSLTGTYQMLGGGIVTVGQIKQDAGLVGTGVAVMNRADGLAESWMELGDSNPKVKAALRKFTEGSTAGTLILMHVTCLMPLLMDRGIIPEQFAPAAAAAMSNGGVSGGAG